jgi:hypothetical protein
MPGQATVPASSKSVRWWVIALTVALAWLGLLIHNAIEFPNMALSRPEYSAPTLAWLALFLIWLLVPDTRWPSNLLFVWGAISLAGAVITVLPLPILPFRPEQSLRHYGVHIIYAVTQLPILTLIWMNVHSERTSGPKGAA